VSDVLYLLLTLAGFGLLAVLAGVLDRTVVSPDDLDHHGGDR
jgi:hypothetical protein